MSLQGTLDTFSLAEILGLVEKSRKTGALEVRDPQSRGVLYFAGGRFSAAEAGDLTGPVASAEELEARLIDVCFELFRVETGLFEFENDRFPPWPVRGGSEVAPVVEQVQQLRRDWLAIEAVLPSLDCRPDVVDELDGDRVVLDKAGFRVLRVVDGDRNVREIARAAGRSVLEVCKVLKDLVEAGAVTVPTDPTRTMVEELVLHAEERVAVAPVLEPAAEPMATTPTAGPAFSEPAPASVESTGVEPTEPLYAEPLYAEPPYLGPSHAGPEPAGPSYAEPVPAEPAYAEPAYRERDHHEPEHHEPEHHEPEHHEPEHHEPDYTDLPEVPGLVVPASPEGLTGVGLPRETPPGPASHDLAAGDLDSGRPGPGGDAYPTEAGEDGQYVAAPLPAAPHDGSAGDTAEPANAAAAAADDDDDDTETPAPDRGALLRMFSSLRDS